MKYFSFILLATFLTFTTSAKCTDGGIYLLSRSSSLNKNSLVILEFYASSQSLIKDLNKKYPIYLKSKNRQITLFPIEILKGEMSITQVLFKPGPGLIANEIYTLVIDHLPGNTNQPLKTDGGLPIKYKISDTNDIQKPVFISIPREQKKTFNLFGCGPASWVYFNVPALDNSEFYVRIEVKNKVSGIKTEYILNPENGQIKVGHGMCSGPVYFVNDRQYEIRFQLVDQSGNKSNFTEVVAFTSPTFST